MQLLGMHWGLFPHGALCSLRQINSVYGDSRLKSADQFLFLSQNLKRQHRGYTEIYHLYVLTYLIL